MSQSSQFNNNNSNNTNKESQIYIPQSKVIQLNNNANDVDINNNNEQIKRIKQLNDVKLSLYS